MDSSYIKLIQSPRVASTTRRVLLERALPANPGYVPKSVTPESFVLLRTVLQLLIPQQAGEDFIDIAAVLDTRRSAGSGDGWRYASMPPDDIALRLGLQSLEAAAQSQYGAPFTALDAAQQTVLLNQVQSGELAWTKVDASKWFEGLLGEATEIYVSHPATLAAMGFSGIAFLPAWPEVGLDTAQPWEPTGVVSSKG